MKSPFRSLKYHKNEEPKLFLVFVKWNVLNLELNKFQIVQFFFFEIFND